MPNSTYPSWWRAESHLPPAPWKYTFELFTTGEDADEWALAAAVFIAQYRRRHPSGPTFRELFEHLLPDTRGFPARLPRDWDRSERNNAIRGFRGQVTAEWRRRGYIGFDRHVTRSLRVGQRFRERSRLLQETKIATDRDTSGGTGASISSDSVTPPQTIEEETGGDPFLASWSADDVMMRLRMRPATLTRLSAKGHLHSIRCAGEVRYPDWQFRSEAKRRVVPGVRIVAPAIPADWPLASIRGFMSTPQGELAIDGEIATPVEWLLCGGDPERVGSILRGVSQ